MNPAEMVNRRIEELVEVLESNYGSGMALEKALEALIHGLCNGFCVYEISSLEDLDAEWREDYEGLVKTLHKVSNINQDLLNKYKQLVLRLEASEVKQKAAAEKKHTKKRRGNVVSIDGEKRRKKYSDDLPF